jgi:hypothetical protein
VRHRVVARLALSLLLVACCPTATARAARGCDGGATPQYSFGFLALRERMGELMGEPVSCEYADPNGSGDTLQDTSTGLAFWRKSSNLPTFTDGTAHWALSSDGVITWTQPTADPPDVAAEQLLEPRAPGPPSQAEWDSLSAWEDWAKQERRTVYQLVVDSAYYDLDGRPRMPLPRFWTDLETWRGWSAVAHQPIGRLFMDMQSYAIQKNGVPMALPSAPDPMQWQQWAQEVGMPAEGFLLAAFFADAPWDGPLEQLALAETNRQRATNGQPAVALDRLAVLAARAEALYDVINLKSHGHEQIADTMGYIGQWPPDRARYFGADQAYIGENLHGLRGPGAVIQGFMDSAGHRANVLMARGQGLPPVVMGYAEATMGRYVNATQTIGSLAARVSPPPVPQPEEQPDQLQKDFNSGEFVWGVFQHAQSFRPSKSGALTRVALALMLVGQPAGALTVEIRDADAAGAPTATVLASSSLSGRAIEPSMTWVDVKLAKPLQVQADRSYVIVLRSDDSAEYTNSYLWRDQSGGSSYPRGTKSELVSGKWRVDASKTHVFQVFLAS